jgi:hypothetical protein
VVDSGVSYTLVPVADLKSILEELHGLGVNCQEPGDKDSLVSTQKCQVEKFEKLPELRIMLKTDSGSKELIMPPEAYLEKSDSDNTYKLKLISNTQTFGSNTADRYWVVGATFLHYYYTIFDY